MLKMYTSATCPKCGFLKNKLEELNIQFEESRNYSEVRGHTSLPLLKKEDGEIMNYENAMLWLGLVERGMKV